jgi:hypothetical protein
MHILVIQGDVDDVRAGARGGGGANGRSPAASFEL